MNKQFIFLLLAVCTITGCADESILEDSVFVNDPQNPGLPVYSELGYNTFGVFYDRQPFRSGSVVPVKVVVEGGSTSFILNGQLSGNEMSVSVQMSDFLPEDYTGLVALDDTVLDLEDEDYTVTLEENGNKYVADILNGTFHFKRTQRLYVDKQLFGVVLSGTFEFRAIVEGKPVTFSSGRFDVSVNGNNFYLL